MNNFGNVVESSSLLENAEIPSAEDICEKEHKTLKVRDYLIIVILCVDTVCHALGYAMMTSFYPVLAENRGLSLTDIGLIMAMLPLSTIFFGLFFSYLLKKFGTRRILLFSLIAEAFFLIPFAFAMKMPGKVSFYVFSAICRAGQGIGFVGCQVSTFAIAAGDYNERMGTVMGFIEMSIGVGMALGPAIGGVLFDVCSSDQQNIINSNQDGKTLKLSNLLNYPALFIPFVICIDIFNNGTYFDVSIAPYLTETFHESASVIGAIYFAAAMTYGILSPLVGYIIEKKSITAQTLILGCFVAGPAFVLSGPAPIFLIGHHLWLTSLCMVIVFAGSALMYVPIMIFCHQISKSYGIEDNEKTRGLLTSLFVLTGNIGLINSSGAINQDSEDFSDTALYHDEKVKRKLWKKDYLNISIIFVDVVCQANGFTFLSSFYPILAKSKGLNIADVGIVMAALPVAQIIFGIVFSRLLTSLYLQLSKIGTRRLLLSSLVFEILALIPFSFVMELPSGAPFYAVSIVCRVGQGIAFVASQISAFSIAAGDYNDKMSSVMGLLEMANGVGSSMGPAVGGLLFDALGFKAPFYFLAGISAVLFILTYVFVHPTYSYATKPRNDSVIARDQTKMQLNIQNIFKVPAIFLPLLTCATTFTTFMTIDLSLAAFLFDKFKLNSGMIGLIFLGTVVLYSILSPVTGYILEKKGSNGLTMVLGCVITSVALIFVGPAPFFHFEQENGIVDNEETRGFISSAFVHTGNIGSFCGPFFGGRLVNSIGFEYTFVLYSGGTVLIVSEENFDSHMVELAILLDLLVVTFILRYQMASG
ncbi:MFS-type transporter SLC18B1 [Nymphon striatum]|nr:MFS-type transporter SLC18B1 [Nymphon striatum]